METKKINVNESPELLLDEIKNASSIDDFLDGFISFFNRNKFDHTSDSPDSDMLLYQAGHYDLPDYNFFVVNITRQFEMPNDDEYFQLSLDILFDREFFDGIEDHNIWSYTFQSIEDWSQKVKDEDSFHIARNVELLKAEVSLSPT